MGMPLNLDALALICGRSCRGEISKKGAANVTGNLCPCGETILLGSENSTFHPDLQAAGTENKFAAKVGVWTAVMVIV